MMFSLQQLAAALGGYVSGEQVTAPGPGHSSTDRSLSIKISPTAPDGFLVFSHAGDDPLACKDYVRERLGLPGWSPGASAPKPNSIANMHRRASPRAEPISRTLEETFNMPEAIVTPLHKGQREHIYTLADGTPVRKVTVAYGLNGKKRVLQYGRAGDGWDLNADKGPIVPYRLPELLKYPDAPVFIVEGEKDVETLECLGHLATTNPMGAEKWNPDLNKHLVGRDITLLPDKDETGERHIQKVYSNLKDIAGSIKVLRLEDLPPKGDVSDWFDAGHTNEEFIELARKAPAYEPGQAKNIPLLVSSADFAAGFVPPDYAIDGLVQRRYLYSLTANTGGGKTAVALLLAAMKALGRRLGERDIDPGHVLYFAGENPADICARWIALCERLGVDPAAMNVHFLPGTGKLSDIAPRIKEEVERIGCEVSLIIIDTSIAYFDGDDENNNIQAVAHAHRMRTLINLPGGPCVIVLCHPTKRALREDLLPRGGGAFLNEVDGNLTCWNDDGIVTLHQLGKFRGPDFEPINFQLKAVVSEKIKDSKGRKMPTVLASVLSKEEERVAERNSSDDEDALLLAIADNKRASFAGLAVALGWISSKGENKAKVRRCADRLKKDKLVRPDRQGTLTLTDKGEAEVERLSSTKKAQKG